MITRDPLKRLDGHHLDVFVRTEKEEEEEVKKVSSSRVKRTEGAWTVSGKQRDGVGSNFAAPPNMRERETPTQAQYHTVPHHVETPAAQTSREETTQACSSYHHCGVEPLHTVQVKRAWAT